jgi:hypothetical protein
MASPRSFVAALAATVSVFVLASAGSARAAGEDCPPGSVWKTNESYGWCEPTVCQNDGQCEQSEVCRPIPLCLLVGKEDPDAAMLGKAKQRLEATAPCAADRTCPQNSVCSVLARCVARIKADKMGLLAVPNASASAATAATDVPAKKSACGCHAVGAPTAPAGALGWGLAAVAALSRRRARAGRRAPSPPQR